MRLIAPIFMLALAACGPTNEIDNPRLFRVMAEHHKPGGQVVYEDISAQLHCTSWACEDTRYAWCAGERCDEPTPRCECDGSYVLTGSRGLSFKFHGTEGIRRGESSTKDGTLMVSFNGDTGTGTATVSRSRLIDVGIDDYAVDLAGGFSVRVGSQAFVRGIFYSLPTQGE